MMKESTHKYTLEKCQKMVRLQMEWGLKSSGMVVTSSTGGGLGNLVEMEKSGISITKEKSKKER